MYTVGTQPPLHSVGVREFRARSADYLQGDAPIAVTRHGQVIGLYFPLPPEAGEVRRALERLGDAVDRIRARTGMSEDELSDWFNLRKPAPE